MAGMTLLAADQLDWYVGKPWAMIIDVRNRREYEKGHVKGAVNLPYDHLLERVCLPRDKILVICCERGAASMAEGKRLAENGYEKSEYSKNQKNSRDCNHVKDREMSSYGQQNREQDEKDEYEKY